MGATHPFLVARRLPVQGVLLDVIETLFSAARLRHAFAANGLDPAQLPLWLSLVFSQGAAFAAAQDYRRFQDVAAHALLAVAPEGLGRDAVHDVLDCLGRLEPHPDTRLGLAALRASGVRVLTLSLLDASLCETLFARAGLRALVDGFLSVDTVRRWKPAPEPYIYGVAQIGWPAGQVALISAHDWDIHGAHRAGLQTAYIARCATPAPPLFDGADFTGPDLPSVVEKLLQHRP